MSSFVLLLALAVQPVVPVPQPGVIYVVESEGIKLFGRSQGMLCSVQLPSGKLTRLTPPLDIGFGDHMQVSPNGQYVVYPHQHQEGGSYHSYQQIRDLTAGDSAKAARTILNYGQVVAWTKDSRQFVLEENITWAKAHHLVDAATLKMTPIALPVVPKPTDPTGRWGHVIVDISPDGEYWLTKTLLGDYLETPTGLHLVHRQTLKVRTLKHLPPVPYARFSPDGKQVLLMSSQQVRLAGMEAGPVTTITPPNIMNLHLDCACWSPDGQQIACCVIKDQEKGSVLVLMDAQGKHQREVSLGKDPVLLSAGPCWR